MPDRLCSYLTDDGFERAPILVTAARNCTEAGARLQPRNFLISLTVSMSYCPAPGWRNWQTQRTQNPPRFTPRGGSTPPPGTKQVSSQTQSSSRPCSKQLPPRRVADRDDCGIA